MAFQALISPHILRIVIFSMFCRIFLGFHEFIVFCGTIWPSLCENPIFYSILWRPSKSPSRTPGGQNLENIVFFYKFLCNFKTTEKSLPRSVWKPNSPPKAALGTPCYVCETPSRDLIFHLSRFLLFRLFLRHVEALLELP